MRDFRALTSCRQFKEVIIKTLPSLVQFVLYTDLVNEASTAEQEIFQFMYVITGISHGSANLRWSS